MAIHAATIKSVAWEMVRHGQQYVAHVRLLIVINQVQEHQIIIVDPIVAFVLLLSAAAFAFLD